MKTKLVFVHIIVLRISISRNLFLFCFVIFLDLTCPGAFRERRKNDFNTFVSASLPPGKLKKKAEFGRVSYRSFI